MTSHALEKQDIFPIRKAAIRKIANSILILTSVFSSIYSKGISQDSKWSIDHVEGVVAIKPHLDLYWTKIVTPMNSPPNSSLLKVSSDSEATISFYEDPLNRDSSKKIIVHGPSLVRLDEKIFRQVTQQEHYLEQQEDIFPSNQALDGVFAFENAWSRFIAFVNSKRKSWPSENQDSGIQYAAEFTEIKMLAPIQEESFQSNLPSTRVQVEWAKPQKMPLKERFEIFFWRKGTTIPKAGIKTRHQYHTLTTHSPGKYFVAIKGEKGNFRSKVLAFYIETPDQRSVRKDSKRSDFISIYPLDQQLLFSSNSTQPVFFSWRMRKGLVVDLLKIENLDSGKEKRITLAPGRDFYSLSLPTATYQFQLIY